MIIIMFDLENDKMDEIKLWKIIIPKCDIVFDVGNQDDNVFYDIKKNIKEVHLFDPVASKTLLEKIKDIKNIFYNDFALGNITEEKEFHYYYGSFLYRSDLPIYLQNHNTIVVKIKRLVDYVNDNNIKYIDYLKIDTEGFDYEVIKGCDYFIDNIKYIQFEKFPYYYDNVSVDDVLEKFKNWNIYLISGIISNYLITKENLEYIEFIKKIN